MRDVQALLIINNAPHPYLFNQTVLHTSALIISVTAATTEGVKGIDAEADEACQIVNYLWTNQCPVKSHLVVINILYEHEI